MGGDSLGECPSQPPRHGMVVGVRSVWWQSEGMALGHWHGALLAARVPVGSLPGAGLPGRCKLTACTVHQHVSNRPILPDPCHRIVFFCG